MPDTPGPGYPDQTRKRLVFRVLGVLSMLTALVLIGLAAADFYASFTADDPFVDDGPDRFWMFFLALPFFAAGGFMLQLGFGGALARYGAGESAPVLKDTARYLSDGRGVLGVGVSPEHARAGQAEQTAQRAAAAGPYCRRCGTRNDADARFCDACGSDLG